MLKHAKNPVSWFPWCEEAFDKAGLEKKPIFVSIGYFACHWCNVMERESFENPEIAKFLNEHFVAIKVDREELPDIDHQYQTAYQVLRGRGGGWPLSVFMDKSKTPFYIGTYYPPRSSMGMPGFLDVLLQIVKAWGDQKNIELAKKSLTNHLSEVSKRLLERETQSLPERNMIRDAANELASMYDQEFGGFGGAPKFPHESAISFLLYSGARDSKAMFVKMALSTLDFMINGGIFDQIGGGFHRYSVDNKWLVPHFEKMLYTQAQMADVLIDAFQISGKVQYKDLAIRVLDFAIKEISSPEGGFFSGIDADSEGEEGKFFVWEKEDIENALSPQDASIFCDFYGVSNKGNWEGKNILHVTTTIERVAKKAKHSEQEILASLSESTKALYNLRSTRISPGIDTKILTGWSALLVRPLLRMALILGRHSSEGRKYSEKALRTLEHIKNRMFTNGTLYRVYSLSNNRIVEGTAKVVGYLEDYAYSAMAMLDGYEFTLDTIYLSFAVTLAEIIIQDFRDPVDGACFFSKVDHRTPIDRFKDIFDSPLPSPNSVVITLYQRLYFYTENSKWIDFAERALSAFSPASEQASGLGMSTYFLSLARQLDHNSEIIVVYPRVSDSNQDDSLWLFLQQAWIPNRAQIEIREGDSQIQAQIRDRSWFLGKRTIDGKTTAYICRNFVCSQPMTTIAEIGKYLTSQSSSNTE